MADYVEQYDVTTPTGDEARSQGDDRIRELKRSVKEIFQTWFNWNHPNFLTWKDKVIPTNALADKAVTAAKIADQTIGAAQIASGVGADARVLGFTPAKARGSDILTIASVFTGVAGEHVDHVMAGVTANDLVFMVVYNTSDPNSIPAWARDGSNHFVAIPLTGSVRIYNVGGAGGGLDNGDRLQISVMGA